VSLSQKGKLGKLDKTKIYISADEEEKMISWYEAHPALWDISGEAYKRTSTRQRDEMYNEYARASGIDGLEGLYI